MFEAIRQLVGQIVGEMFKKLPTEAGGELWHRGAKAGAKKISNLGGRNAGEVEAAKAVAEEFISCLKRNALGFAKAQCTESLIKEVETKGGLRRCLDDIDFSSAAWQCEEPETEHFFSGGLWTVTFPGLLVDAKKSGQPGTVDVRLKIVLVKEKDKWKVGGFSG